MCLEWWSITFAPVFVQLELMEIRWLIMVSLPLSKCILFFLPPQQASRITPLGRYHRNPSQTHQRIISDLIFWVSHITRLSIIMSDHSLTYGHNQISNQNHMAQECTMAQKAFSARLTLSQLGSLLAHLSKLLHQVPAWGFGSGHGGLANPLSLA